MLNPTSEKTAKLFSPIQFTETDRLAISLTDTGNFNVNIYGRSLSEEEYKKQYRNNYSNKYNPKTETYEYFALPSYPARTEFPKRVPERKHLDDKLNYRGDRWEFAATDITASLIYKLWIEPYPEENKVSFKDSDAELLFKYLIASAARMSKNAEIVSRYKIAKEELELAKEKAKKLAADSGNNLQDSNSNTNLQELEMKLVPDCDLQFCAERPLAPYQQVALYLQNTNECFASFMEQGTGKTPPSIANVDNLALQKWEKEQKILKVLIICPNNVRANWAKEFQNFSTVNGRVTILRGTEMDRVKSIYEALFNITDELYTVVICGYDIVSRFKPLTELKQFPDGDTDWDAVICDESHYFKDSRTKRWEQGLIKLRGRSKRRYVLTGTPICNSINDLWSQLEFLRKGGSGFLNFKNFVDFYSVFDEYSRTVGYQNLPFIQERLAMCSFSITKKEALPDLPEKVYDIIEVEMTPKQKLVYQKIATELQYKIDQEIEASGGHPDAMTVNNILTQLLRLAQITCGFITYDEIRDDDGNVIKPKRVERFKEQPKMDAVVEILKQQQPTEKSLLWCCFHSDIEAWQERLTQEGIKYVVFYGGTSEADRKEAEYLFNNDDSIQVFIGSAAAGGTGLNLLGYPPQHPELSECNVTLEVFYSQNWSAVQRSQAEDRAHRRGTRTNVRIVDPQVPNTIDAEIRQRVVDKRQTAADIQDIKCVLRNILSNLELAGAGN